MPDLYIMDSWKAISDIIPNLRTLVLALVTDEAIGIVSFLVAEWDVDLPVGDKSSI